MNLTSSLRFLTLLFVVSFLFPAQINAQRQPEPQLEVALRYLEQEREKWQLTPEDIADVIVSDQYQSQHNGVSHYFFIQRHQGIEVYNAIAGIHLRSNGKLGFSTSRFTPNLAEKINTTQAALTPYDAVRRVASDLSLVIEAPLRVMERKGSKEILFDGGSISNADIPVKLVFKAIPGTDDVRLAWNLIIDQIETSAYWSIQVDALTGKILEKINQTVSCSAKNMLHHRHDTNCGMGAKDQNTFFPKREALEETNTAGNASYRIYPLPLENSLEGERELLVDPHDPIASPYGWHDTDGTEGAEFTITRGNNAHVFLDLDDKDESAGDETDGGEDLLFDFPVDFTQEPEEYQDAANTQLFYMMNIMHDFSYQYGFDEAAGNFQSNNYGKDGIAGDYVFGNTQDGGNIKDEQHTNNADFTAKADGVNGLMQVYLWNRTTNNLLTVLAPNAINGSYEASTASFGPAISAEPIEASVVEAVDDSNQPRLACSDIINVEEVTGKIALVDRGSCFFKQKTFNVEAAGAIALIICNFEESLVGMGGGGGVPDVNIPTVMLKNSDCQVIRQFLATGVDIRLVLPDNSGPVYIDGSFDNGVMAHEYGHGISGRLTGGPSRPTCISHGPSNDQNFESMDEGTADFFNLVIAHKTGDTGESPKGIGSYLINRQAEGLGVRLLPYSTDMTLNGLAYDDIIGQPRHQRGEIWALTLWDLYWRMIDLYNYDPDLYNGNGGNNKAIQLIMDGLKLQACNPGFLDSRDALIAADAILFNGDHECLLWEVFARRGMGWDAIQGSPLIHTDNVEGFKTQPSCLKTLKIEKTTSEELINPGDEITYTLMVSNHTDDVASGVMVNDVLPAGATVKAGSTTGPFPAAVNGTTITWDAGDIPAGQEFELRYTIITDPGQASNRLYYDDMENNGDNWIQQNLQGTGIWDLSKDAAFSGEQSWFVPNTKDDNDQALLIFDPISVSGNQPVLRFYHKYETEPINDGGIVQISTDGGINWDFVDEQLFKHSYRRRLSYNAFAIPNIGGFWGELDQFTPSYINLSSYKGENILIRFRFGSNIEGENGTSPYEGWYIDDFELLDMVNYETEACVSAQNGSSSCDRPDQRGTIVESTTTNAISEIESLGAAIRVFPNPVKDQLQLTVESQKSGDLLISFLNLDGKTLQEQQQWINVGFNRTTLDVGAIPAGMYILRLSNAGEVATQKIIVD